MKKLIYSLIISTILLVSSIAFADTQVTLGWDANAPKDNVTEYWIYDNLNKISDSTGLSKTIIVPDGDHSFTITAWNKNGESLQSGSVDRVYFTAVPGQPSTPLATDEIQIP